MLVDVLLLLHICGLTLASDNTDKTATLCTSDACFTLHMDNVSFEDAHMKCKDNGGYLFTSKDNIEEAELQSILSRINKRYQSWDLKFWIGLKLCKGDCVIDRSILKGFKWISDTKTYEYSNWDKEPRSTCTEDRCVTIQYNLSRNNKLKWTDGSCKDTAYFACKFYFRGMCKPLSLAGQGKMHYTPPFSEIPLNEDSNLNLLPIGTFAEVNCNDNSKFFSICRAVNNWTDPGPFCALDKRNCDFQNGGCDHLCFDINASSVRCACKQGYELGNNKVSCIAKDHCQGSPCQHQCITKDEGFSCLCSKGYQLQNDQFKCIDTDECQMQACDDHYCINTQGSYTCICREGYKMVDGKCLDIDECTDYRCSQRCLNSQGSFSCHCIAGFTASADGHSCIDIDECLVNRCEYKCTNTLGSFKCLCQKNFRLHLNGLTCIRDLIIDSTATAAGGRRVPVTYSEMIEAHTMSMVEIKNKLQYTNSTNLYNVSITHEKPHRKVLSETNAQRGKTFNSRLLVCVIASVVPIVILIAVTFGLVIFRCGRSKRDSKKKSATADSYCWVSSGLETQFEKLNVSILTDDS